MFLCFVTTPEWLPSFFLISSNNVGKIVAQKQQMKNWKWSNVIIWDDNRKGLEANTVAFDHVIIKRGFVLLVKICMMYHQKFSCKSDFMFLVILTWYFWCSIQICLILYCKFVYAAAQVLPHFFGSVNLVFHFYC